MPSLPRLKGFPSVSASVVYLVIPLVACSWIFASEGDLLTLFEQGKQRMKKGEYNLAIDAFSKALTLSEDRDRNSNLVRFARANAYYKSGDLKRSLKDLESVLVSGALDEETRASCLQLRGILNLKTSREREALRDFTSAIKTSHDNTELRSASFANRGVTLVQLGEYDRGVSDLQHAIRLDPRSAFAYAGRGLAYLRMDKIEAARRDAEKVLGMNPDEQPAAIARRILNELSVSFSGPDRVSVPIADDGHVFVQVRFARKGQPHRFLLDTGATYSLVSRDLLETIRKNTEVKEIGTGKVMTADGATHSVTRYRVKNAFLFNLPLGEIEVHVFSGKRKVFANLLGAKSLKNVTVSIDTASQKAEISRIARNPTATHSR